MADEELNLDISTPEEEQENNVEKRIKDLSGKVKLTAEERDVAKAESEKSKAEAETARKDAEFYKNFNTSAAKYQGAGEFQDKIREKVMAGYDIEDAMVSVLNKEGKFTPSPAAPIPPKSPVGGSAPTTVKADIKPLNEMSRDEMRAALVEAEKRGDLGLT